MRPYPEVIKDWEPVIGLEVHVQLQTQTKLFCACKRQFGDEPNIHTCPVCLGMPGSLPVVNEKAVELAVALGLAFNFTINQHSVFARKNYFYPDLPKGYQISQFEIPINEHGNLDVVLEDGVKKIGITRAHIEEDAGKLIHDQSVGSVVDLNRCGTPLVEIVSEPDMNSPEEVRAYLDRLKQTIQYIGVSDCDMEKGNLRVDLNVSLRKRGIKNLGIRREVKNLNSFRFVERALRYEVVKQAEILEMGNEVDQCTLLWDEKADRSYVIRSKEDAPDYRYFPDPDLPPVIITDEQLKHICSGMPELPADRENRFVTQFTLTLVDAKRLTVDRALADYFESVVKLTKSPVRSANWILGRLLKAVNESGVSISEFHITPDGFAELILLIENETITEPIAREVFVKMVETSSSAKKIVENEGLSTTSEDLVVEAIESIIDKHPHEVERFRNGEVKLKGFFIGQVMRATGGKADPRQLNMVLDEKLK